MSDASPCVTQMLFGGRQTKTVTAVNWCSARNKKRFFSIARALEFQIIHFQEKSSNNYFSILFLLKQLIQSQENAMNHLSFFLRQAFPFLSICSLSLALIRIIKSKTENWNLINHRRPGAMKRKKKEKKNGDSGGWCGSGSQHLPL